MRSRPATSVVVPWISFVPPPKARTSVARKWCSRRPLSAALGGGHFDAPALQFVATADAAQRIHPYAETKKPGSAELLGTPVGQVVGQMNRVKEVRQVVFEMVDEHLDTVERMSALLETAAAE